MSELFTAPEAAAELGVSRRTITRLALAAGVGRRRTERARGRPDKPGWLFTVQDLEALRLRRARRPPGRQPKGVT